MLENVRRGPLAATIRRGTYIAGNYGYGGVDAPPPQLSGMMNSMKASY